MVEQINKRQVDRLIRDVRVASAPHMEKEEAEEFAKDLINQRNELYGLEEIADQIDIDALDALKSEMTKNRSKMGVK